MTAPQKHTRCYVTLCKQYFYIEEIVGLGPLLHATAHLKLFVFKSCKAAYNDSFGLPMENIRFLIIQLSLKPYFLVQFSNYTNY